MRPAMRTLCNALEWCGVAILVLVSFPLIAVAVFFFRAVAAALLAALIVGAVTAWFAHAPFRTWVFTRFHGPRATHS